MKSFKSLFLIGLLAFFALGMCFNVGPAHDLLVRPCEAGNPSLDEQIRDEMDEDEEELEDCYHLLQSDPCNDPILGTKGDWFTRNTSLYDGGSHDPYEDSRYNGGRAPAQDDTQKQHWCSRCYRFYTIDTLAPLAHTCYTYTGDN